MRALPSAVEEGVWGVGAMWAPLVSRPMISLGPRNTPSCHDGAQGRFGRLGELIAPEETKGGPMVEGKRPWLHPRPPFGKGGQILGTEGPEKKVT